MTEYSVNNVPRLPLELIDIIFGQLRPDETVDLAADIEVRDTGIDVPHPNHDLASCSLVCRDWWELSHRHLFHNIAFSFQPEINALRLYEAYTGNAGPITSSLRKLKTLADLVEFLRHNQSLGQYITKLALIMYPLKDSHIIEGDNYPLYELPSQSLFYDLLSILSPFHLRKLDLQNVMFNDEPVNRDPNLQSTFLVDVEELSLSYNQYPDVIYFNFIREILYFFRSIKTFKMDRVTMDEDFTFGNRVHDGIIPAHIEIKELVILDIYSIVYLVPTGPANSSLRALCSLVAEFSGNAYESDLQGLNELLYECRSGLEKLRYDLYPTRDPANTVNIYDLHLSQCSYLHTLILTLPIYPRGYLDSNVADLNEPTWIGLANMFSESPPPNLRCLCLILDQVEGRLKTFEYNTPGLVTLERVLTQLPNLQETKIIPRFRSSENQHYVDIESEDPLQVKSDEKFDNWLDPEFPVKLFPELFLEWKIDIGGSNSLLRSPFASVGQEILSPTWRRLRTEVVQRRGQGEVINL